MAEQFISKGAKKKKTADQALTATRRAVIPGQLAADLFKNVLGSMKKATEKE